MNGNILDYAYDHPIKVMLICFLALVVISVLVYPIGSTIVYSEGERTGDIYKFSYKGIIWKSWEGEMYLGGLTSGHTDKNTIGIEKFYFSIPANETTAKANIIEKIKECSRKRAKCTISYEERLIGPLYINSPYIVTGVKEEDE
jgi:hypothetical protein